MQASPNPKDHSYLTGITDPAEDSTAVGVAIPANPSSPSKFFCPVVLLSSND